MSPSVESVNETKGAIMNETIQAIINDITSTDDGPITAFVILSRGLALAKKADASGLRNIEEAICEAMDAHNASLINEVVIDWNATC